MIKMQFLESLDKDLQQTVLNQLRDQWTHSSTAIEGNTLSLGDTKFILDEGLTVSGKPIKEHNEVIGHAKAIDLMYSMIGRKINKEDIFLLHKAIQIELISDIYKPNGDWKVEQNGTYALDDSNKRVYIEYAHPYDVDFLMDEVIQHINLVKNTKLTTKTAPEVYANIHSGIVHIHPFWDGNGRIARLVSNLPILNSGLPPIIIDQKNRKEYIELLSKYQRIVGQIDKQTGVWPEQEKLHDFEDFCIKSYSMTHKIIEEAKKQQNIRKENYL